MLHPDDDHYKGWNLSQMSCRFVAYTYNINPLQPIGHYMYRQFNIQQFYVLLTLYLCVLCGSENKQRLFPYTALTDWFL